MKDRALPSWLEIVCSEVEHIREKENNGGEGLDKKTSSEFPRKCIKGLAQKGEGTLQDLCFIESSACAFHG